MAKREARSTLSEAPADVARMIAGPDVPQVAPTNGPPTSLSGEPFKVRATRIGYYDHVRRREGDVFLVDARAFSGKWMERVHPSTRERITNSPQALRKAHDDILGIAPPDDSVL
jgi:hypothetical protein